MENIESIQQEIINEFDFFDDWSEKYQYLIDLGKNLPTFNEINRVDIAIIGIYSIPFLYHSYII